MSQLLRQESVRFGGPAECGIVSRSWTKNAVRRFPGGWPGAVKPVTVLEPAWR
jgi:hypothetical protein